MQERYYDDISRIDSKVGKRIMHAMGVNRRQRQSLFDALHQAGKDQADLVLALLWLDHPNAREYIERLMGCKIKYCKCVYRWRPVPLIINPQIGDDRCLVRVSEDPRFKSGRKPWLPKWHLFKRGMPITYLRAHGVTRRQIRLYEKRGWIVVGESAAVPRSHVRSAAGGRR
jgi:hypothetical protein